MTMSVQAAAQALREATQETVRRYSTWYLIQGVLMVIAGIVALLYPFVSSAALVLFLGWILIISGIIQGFSLIGAQNVPNFWLQLVSAVLSIIVGVLFLRRPGEAVVTLALLLIVFFMVEGFAKIVFSLTIRPLPNWGWVLASGCHWNTAVFLSFSQPHHDSSLAARCVARDPAYLRRGGSQLAGVAGASERVEEHANWYRPHVPTTGDENACCYGPCRGRRS